MLPCGSTLPHMASMLATGLHAGVCASADGKQVYLVFEDGSWLLLTHYPEAGLGEWPKPAHRIEVDFPGRMDWIELPNFHPHKPLHTKGLHSFPEEFDRLRECVTRSRERMANAPQPRPPFWQRPHIMARLRLLRHLRPDLWSAIKPVGQDGEENGDVYLCSWSGAIYFELNFDAGTLSVQHRMRMPQTAEMLLGGQS